MSFNLDTILKEVKKNVIKLAEKEAKGYISQASSDAIDFVKLISNNLTRWAQAVVAGNLSIDELKFLLKGQKELLVMHSLSQAGLAAVKVQRVRDGIIDILLDSISNVIFTSDSDVSAVPIIFGEFNQMGLVTAEYIWIDGSQPTSKLRSKTKILENPNKSTAGLISPIMQLTDFPDWGFDGSSTNQAEGSDSDCILKPVVVYRDPIRGGNNSYLILCEVYTAGGKPHKTNTRAALRSRIEHQDTVDAMPWIGFEQEYTMFKDLFPLGWPICKHGSRAEPPQQGPYYCGVGSDEVSGRYLVEEHMNACMDIGISICGVNAEVMLGQWEFQIGYRGDNPKFANPLHASDDLWVARWLLYRLSEKYGITITVDVKPVRGDWNGAGCHTNFSTINTRTNMSYIYDAIRKLENNHDAHIAVYGYDLNRRLTGAHETCDINTFKAGEADRSASIRIPRHVAKARKGYIEDRRPGANCDPYAVSSILIDTIIIGAGG